MKRYIKICQSILCAFLVGIVAGLLCFTPFGINLEEEYGLAWLFNSRGTLRVTDNVIIVSIDKLSADILHLPDDPEKWPRSYYAQLIEKLNQQNPAIIALNMTFGKSRGEKSDKLLAEVMLKGKNIVLSNYIKQSIVRAENGSGQFKYERIIEPLAILEKAALVTAPFPLPRTASTVKQFWTYKQSAGDIATFPVVIFQSFLFKQAYAEILELLSLLNPTQVLALPASSELLWREPHVINIIHAIHSQLAQDEQSSKKLEELIKQSDFSMVKKRLLQAWVALLKNPDSLYFNHYGGASTIPTIPFYRALISDILNPNLFKDKIVLVGYSENIESEKKQGFYTVFSETDFDTVSPIEIAATAVANLVDNHWVRPLSMQYQFLLLLGWSCILFWIYHMFNYKWTLALIMVANLIYLFFVTQWFYVTAIWMPVFIPVLLLTPLVVIVKTASVLLIGIKEHKTMEKAFGLYLPNDVVSSLKRSPNMLAMTDYGESMLGVCLSTDAAQYTRLSEEMMPEQLNRLINEYYSTMFPVVQKNSGIILDVVGDAMFAVWPATEKGVQARVSACLTALEVVRAVTQFNQEQCYPLRTRLGLHFGDIRLGNVGAAEHYEYRAVGNTVNTASRIEGLNKYLGTQLLVSADVIQDLTHFMVREVGFFIMKGKTRPIHIYELISYTEQQEEKHTAIVKNFLKGFVLFQAREWDAALQIWLESEHSLPSDGPTRFYIQYVQQNLNDLLEQTDKSQPVIIDIGKITYLLASD